MGKYDDDKVFEKELKKIKDEAEKLKKEAEVLHKFWTTPPKLTFPGLSKDYAKAVKATKGLTTMKPSCTKALTVAEKKPSDKSFKDAAKALQEHAVEVEKENKGDKKATQFKKDIIALIGTLKKELASK
ncbi:Hypothetical protein PBC10988_10200 [Planctomycetales bacterium 10988]|nr:Hypothetical protein PBC10988_10200 [Planctomycetales bacterium 10988]